MDEEQDNKVTNISFIEVPVYVQRRAQFPPLRLSPSSITLFCQCPQLYKFVKIDKLGERYRKARPYFTMANHVHDTLRDFMSLVPIEHRTTETIEKILRRNWQRYRIGFKDREDENRWAKKALAEVKAFVSSQDVSVRPYLVEASLEAEITPGVILQGRLDRVDKEHDNCLHIIDYKTGSMPQESDWMQLRLYALLLSRRSPYPVRKLSYLYLGPAIMESETVNEEGLKEAHWQLLGTARSIVREKQFLPKPGPWCRACDFISICPQQPAIELPRAGDIQLELWRDFWVEAASKRTR